jgi:hypothetical protein
MTSSNLTAPTQPPFPWFSTENRIILAPAAWRSGRGTEDPGSNPARVLDFGEIIAMLMCYIDLIHMHCLCLIEK